MKFPGLKIKKRKNNIFNMDGDFSGEGLQDAGRMSGPLVI